MAALHNMIKIRPQHRERSALIYVRQSSLAQVRHHTTSTRRQYDLAQRALDLGWVREQIHVIDADQGQSGASATERDGFPSLVAQVGLGRVGAVLCLEASRLARACSDWYRLLEICALTDTLVIDEDGIYDPGQYNDRLLLGFKGTMSEAELHWLRQRLIGGLWEKARQGTLRVTLPTGFVYDPAGRIVLDPDAEVQAAVRLVFARFEQLGSALSVVREFGARGLLFPTRLGFGAPTEERIWRPLYLGRLIRILHNPVYAGAYAYGYGGDHNRGRLGGPPCRPAGTGAPGEPPILLREAHPGYLSWEQFVRNQERLEENRPSQDADRRGAVREGAALLQGIVLCGRCGRGMTVFYAHDGTTPGYVCHPVQYGAGVCQRFQGDGVDAAVAQVFLEALQPAQLELSLAVLDQVEARERQVERQWELRQERARYEADLARRRFVAVDPENRLVARTLEREWNEKLAEAARLEEEAAARTPRGAARVSAAERQQILDLARNLPAVWQAATTTNVQRKQLLRLLIRDVSLTRREETIQVGIRWQTGAVTAVETPRPRRSWETQGTDRRVIERVRELAPGRSDGEVAACLNAEGVKSARGRALTRQKVGWLRRQAGIAPGLAEEAITTGEELRVNALQAAALLGVHPSTVIAWCKTGRLTGSQALPNGPWRIRLTQDQIEVLRPPLRAESGGRTPERRTG